MSAPVTAEELASVDDLVRTLDSTEISEADLDLAIRRTIHLMPRLARDLTAERARTAEIESDRDALAAKIETMLRDEEDARRLRLAEHAAREDVAGKLAELQAAVRAHEQLAGADKPVAFAAAEDAMWAAAKA